LISPVLIHSPISGSSQKPNDGPLANISPKSSPNISGSIFSSYIFFILISQEGAGDP